MHVTGKGGGTTAIWWTPYKHVQTLTRWCAERWRRDLAGPGCNIERETWASQASCSDCYHLHNTQLQLSMKCQFTSRARLLQNKKVMMPYEAPKVNHPQHYYTLDRCYKDHKNNLLVTVSKWMSICNSCNEMIDVNAVFIREAKHARDTHLTCSFIGNSNSSTQ